MTFDLEKIGVEMYLTLKYSRLCLLFITLIHLKYLKIPS